MTEAAVVPSGAVYHDVAGAPVRIGQRVRVVQVVDDTPENGRADVGRFGKVRYLNYDCGCGQTYPSDPMIGVSFAGRVEEFWAEELEAL